MIPPDALDVEFLPFCLSIMAGVTLRFSFTRKAACLMLLPAVSGLREVVLLCSSMLKVPSFDFKPWTFDEVPEAAVVDARLLRPTFDRPQALWNVM
jgi:hypothetical protein